MKIIKPTPVTPSALAYSNVTENDAPDWSASKTGGYNQGDRVMDSHHVWEWLSSAAGNTTVAPSADTSATAKWLDTGPTNRWKMFDKESGNTWRVGMATTNSETIDVKITPGAVVNAIGLFGLVASRVQIKMTEPTGKEGPNNDGVVYDSGQVNLADVGVSNWYDYFFMPLDRNEALVDLKLPAYGNATVQVTITNPGATAAASLLVLGQYIEIGDSIYGTSLGLQSYSTTTEDVFGNVSIVRRGNKNVVDYDVRIPTENLDSTFRTLRRLQNTACVFVGNESMEATITVGYFENLRETIASPAAIEMSLEVRSLA